MIYAAVIISYQLGAAISQPGSIQASRPRSEADQACCCEDRAVPRPGSVQLHTRDDRVCRNGSLALPTGGNDTGPMG